MQKLRSHKYDDNSDVDDDDDNDDDDDDDDVIQSLKWRSRPSEVTFRKESQIRACILGKVKELF